MYTCVLCVFRRVKDRLNLPHYSPLSKNSCVRQVVLDRWLPLNIEGTSRERVARRGGASSPRYYYMISYISYYYCYYSVISYYSIIIISYSYCYYYYYYYYYYY